MYDQVMRGLFDEKLDLFKTQLTELELAPDMRVFYQGHFYSGDELQEVFPAWKNLVLKKVSARESCYRLWCTDLLKGVKTGGLAKRLLNNASDSSMVNDIFYSSDVLEVSKALIEDMMTCAIDWGKGYYLAIKDVLGDPIWVMNRLQKMPSVNWARDFLKELGLRCDGFAGVKDYMDNRFTEVLNKLWNCYYWNDLEDYLRQVLVEAIGGYQESAYCFKNYDKLVEFLTRGKNAKEFGGYSYLYAVVFSPLGKAAPRVEAFLCEFLSVSFRKNLPNPWADSSFVR
jgi:hypothetical protein